MTTKHNPYLDISDGEDEGLRSDSADETARDSRFAQFRHASSSNPKRREISHDSDEELPSDDHEDEEQKAPKASLTAPTQDHDISAHPSSKAPTQSRSKPISDQSTQSQRAPNVVKPLTPAQLEASQRRARKTGVLYISRVPPFMKPSAVRKLLGVYGEILRIFLTPETRTAYLRRRQAGGNSKRTFVDGWVEFASKRRAKVCAELLNGNTIGGKKGSFYHDDLWNIKYLRGFRWDDLMEQVQNEARMREGRLRAEIDKETKERRAFLNNVELAKRERTKEAKRRKRQHKTNIHGDGGADHLDDNATEYPEGDDADYPDGDGADHAEDDRARKGNQRIETLRKDPGMRFRQHGSIPSRAGRPRQDTQDDVTRVLSQIF